jgi:hypothetical protein
MIGPNRPGGMVAASIAKPGVEIVISAMPIASPLVLFLRKPRPAN